MCGMLLCDQRDPACCSGLKAVNKRTVCSGQCCTGLHEVSFDNGRFSSVECLPADDSNQSPNDYDDDDDDSIDYVDR